MTATKRCWNCERVRPVDAFQKTQRGTGRADCCRECVTQSAEAHAAERRRELGRAAAAEPKALPRSNRPRMRECWGCGETVRTDEIWYYHRSPNRRERSNYCKACARLRAIERPCADCGATKLAPERRRATAN